MSTGPGQIWTDPLENIKSLSNTLSIILFWTAFRSSSGFYLLKTDNCVKIGEIFRHSLYPNYNSPTRSYWVKDSVQLKSPGGPSWAKQVSIFLKLTGEWHSEKCDGRERNPAVNACNYKAVRKLPVSRWTIASALMSHLWKPSSPRSFNGVHSHISLILGGCVVSLRIFELYLTY